VRASFGRSSDGQAGQCGATGAVLPTFEMDLLRRISRKMHPSCFNEAAAGRRGEPCTMLEILRAHELLQ
jgi:hypothetical protein